jgi:predicted secreted acid phosphatase
VRHKSSDTGLVNVIDATLASALFHGDHLADYAAAFTKSDKKDNRAAVASYPRHFFDLLRTSVSIDIVGDILSHSAPWFVWSFGRRFGDKF